MNLYCTCICGCIFIYCSGELKIDKKRVSFDDFPVADSFHCICPFLLCILFVLLYLCICIYNQDNENKLQMMTKASLLVLFLCVFLTIGFPTQVANDDGGDEDEEDEDEEDEEEVEDEDDDEEAEE